MSSSKVYLNHVMSYLMPVGNVISKRLFGGYGIYYDAVIFALIFEDKLYFRVDETNIKDFSPFDSKPFVYEGKTKMVQMPYHTLPDEILKDPIRLKKWVFKAYDVSVRKKLKKSTRAGTQREAQPPRYSSFDRET